MEASLKPDQIFGELFFDVQRSGLFHDSKTFADAIPLLPPKEILANYITNKKQEGFDLLFFIQGHFKIFIPSDNIEGITGDAENRLSILDHIESLWPELMRPPDQKVLGSSLLHLPHNYIVPGGRFQEIYYWDSYFTMLGLQHSGHHNLIADMVANFAYLIDHLGYIPNGNRTYFLGRSQPPFFSYMVELLGNVKGEAHANQYLDQLIREYRFWMESDRTVELKDGVCLNRYYDDDPGPRIESFLEDELLMQQNKNKPELYRNLRAACESGWDFSSRWLKNADQLSTIHTSDILPIDLNCLLLHHERLIAAIYERTGQLRQAAIYQQAALERISAIQSIFWNAELEMYFDYDYVQETHTKSITLAAFFPMFLGIANEPQAALVSNFLTSHLFQPGGWQTTDIHSGQQWDAPNGWAPLQWIAFKALQNYSYDDVAKAGAENWLQLNSSVYVTTGKVMEKYNVVDLSLKAGGGEYPVQDGFGWTNGVFVALTKALQGIS